MWKQDWPIQTSYKYISSPKPNDGWPTKKKLQQVLRIKYLCEQISSLITGIQIILDHIEDTYDYEKAITRINRHCSSLECKINAHYEKCVVHLKDVEKNLIGEINLFRRQLICLKNVTPFEKNEAEKEIKIDYMLRINTKASGRVRMIFSPNWQFCKSAKHLGKFLFSSLNVKAKVQQPLLTLSVDLENKAQAVIISTDGLYAGCFENGLIKIWSTENAFFAYKLRGHTSRACCMIKLNNGFLASGSQDRTIIIWSLREKKIIKQLMGHDGAVLSLLELPNGNIASCSEDNTIKIWNLRSKIEKSSLIHSIIISHSYITSLSKLCLLSNGNIIQISLHHSDAKNDSALRVFDPLVGKCVKSFPTSWEHIPSFAVLENDLIALGLESGEIQIFDMNSGNLNVPLKVIESCDNARVTALSRTSCSRLISSHKSFEYSSINIWDWKNGSLCKTIFTNHSKPTDSITISKNESKIFTKSIDNKIQVWPLNLNELL